MRRLLLLMLFFCSISAVSQTPVKGSWSFETLDVSKIAKIPRGTTAQRPAPAVGSLFYNTDSSSLQVSNGVIWVNVGGSGGSTNSNVGTGYRLAIPGTNQIKTIDGVGVLIDTSVTNKVRFFNDTAWLTSNYTLKPIDVFLIAGQSNAQGWVTPATSPTVPAGKVYQYYNGLFSAANDPVGNANTGSAWPAFGIEYNAITGRLVCFVPAAFAGTSQTVAANTGQGTWDTTGTLFDTSVARLNAALSYLIQNRYAPVFKGVLWCQGENDANAINTSLINQTTYILAFQKMIGRYRGVYGKNMPFYIFKTGTIQTGSDVGYASVRAAQEQVSNTDSLTVIVFRGAYDFKARGMMQSTYHYTQPAYNEMGRIAADNIVGGRWNGFQPLLGSLYSAPGIKVGVGVYNPTYPFSVADSALVGGLKFSNNGFGNAPSIRTDNFLTLLNTPNLTIFQGLGTGAPELRLTMNSSSTTGPRMGVLNGFNFNAASARQDFLITTSGFSTSGNGRAGNIVLRPGTDYANGGSTTQYTNDSVKVQLPGTGELYVEGASTFTGNVKLPTQSTSDSSDKAASTKYVKQVLAGYSPGGGSGTTNLDTVRTATSITVTSSTGVDAVIPLADIGSNKAGLLSPGFAKDLQDSVVTHISTQGDSITCYYRNNGTLIKCDTAYSLLVYNSIEAVGARGIQLKNDQTSPGPNKVYGTDASGVLGYKNDPAGGSSYTNESGTGDTLLKASTVKRIQTGWGQVSTTTSTAVRLTVDSTKFNPYKFEGEQIYSKSWVTGTTGWTATGSPSFSTADNNLRLSGGDGTFGKYITLDAPILTPNRCVLEVTFKISNTIAAGHFGIAVGMRSINSWYAPSLVAQYDPIQKKVNIVNTNSSTVQATEDFSNDYTPAQNDIIKITYEQIDNIVTCYFENMTQKKFHVLSVKGNLGATKNIDLPNTSKIVIHEMGGQNDITNVKWTSLQPRNPWIVLIGDSKTFGYSAEDNGSTWAALMRKYGSVANYAGDGDRTVEAVQIIDSIVAQGGKYFFVCIGRNDLASSVSSGTWQANLSTIRTKIVNAGGTIIWVLPIPETNISDQSAINTYINSTFPSDLKVDPSTGWSNATMLSGDGVHPNQYGHRQVFNVIEASGYVTKQTESSYQYDRPVMFGNYIRANSALTPNTYPIASSTGGLKDGVLTAVAGNLQSSATLVVNYTGGTTQITAKNATPIIDWVNASGTRQGYIQGLDNQMTFASSQSGSKIRFTAFAASAALYPNNSFELPDAGFNYTGVSINLTSTTKAMLFDRLNTTQQTALSTQLYGHFFNTDTLALVYRGAASSNEAYATRNWVRSQNYLTSVGNYVKSDGSTTLSANSTVTLGANNFTFSQNSTGRLKLSGLDAASSPSFVLFKQSDSAVTEATPANALNILLPSQTGNSGKYLGTNGTSASWQTVDAFSSATLSTSSTSAQTIASIATNNNERGVIEVTLVGLDQLTGTNGTTGKKLVSYKNVSGTITIISTTDVQATNTDDSSTWTVTSSGANLIIQVTPGSSTATNWAISYKQTKVIFAP